MSHLSDSQLYLTKRLENFLTIITKSFYAITHVVFE